MSNWFVRACMRGQCRWAFIGTSLSHGSATEGEMTACESRRERLEVVTSRSRVDLSEPAYHRHSTQVNEPLAETTSPNPSPLVMRPSTRVRRVNVYENQKTRSRSDMGDTHAAHLTQTLTLTITFGLYYLYIYYKIVREVHDKHRHTIRTMTRSSAIAEGPRDAPCQLKAC